MGKLSDAVKSKSWGGSSVGERGKASGGVSKAIAKASVTGSATKSYGQTITEVRDGQTRVIQPEQPVPEGTKYQVYDSSTGKVRNFTEQGYKLYLRENEIQAQKEEQARVVEEQKVVEKQKKEALLKLSAQQKYEELNKGVETTPLYASRSKFMDKEYYKKQGVALTSAEIVALRNEGKITELQEKGLGLYADVPPPKDSIISSSFYEKVPTPKDATAVFSKYLPKLIKEKPSARVEPAKSFKEATSEEIKESRTKDKPIVALSAIQQKAGESSALAFRETNLSSKEGLKKVWETIEYGTIAYGTSYAKGVLMPILQPKETAKGLWQIVRHPREAQYQFTEQIQTNPAGTIGEMEGFGKGLKIIGKGYKGSGLPIPKVEVIGNKITVGVDYGFKGRGKGIGIKYTKEVKQFTQPKTGVGTDVFLRDIKEYVTKESERLIEGKKISVEEQIDFTKTAVESSRELATQKSKFVDVKELKEGGTRYLTPKEAEIVIQRTKTEGGKLFGSKASMAEIKPSLRREVGDIEAIFETTNEIKLQDITKEYLKDLQRISKKGKFRIAEESPYHIEKFMEGKWEKVAEFKGRGIGEGDVAPEKAFGYELWKESDFVKREGLKTAMARGELKRKLAGSIMLEEGTIGVAHKGRFKDVPDYFRLAETLGESKGNAPKTKEFLKQKEKLGIEIENKPIKYEIVDYTKRVYGKTPSISVSPSIKRVPSVFSPLASLSPSPSPYRSPSLSPSPSPYRSPSLSPSPSPYRSPSLSPSPSPYRSPSLSPSQSPFRQKEEKQQGGQYITETRERGKWRQLSPFPAPLRQVTEQARDYVDETPRASFRIRPTSETKEDYVNKAKKYLPKEKWRMAKRQKGVFVEKSEYRIDSPGEKGGITFKGLHKLKDLRRISWK